MLRSFPDPRRRLIIAHPEYAAAALCFIRSTTARSNWSRCGQSTRSKLIRDPDIRNRGAPIRRHRIHNFRRHIGRFRPISATRPSHREWLFLTVPAIPNTLRDWLSRLLCGASPCAENSAGSLGLLAPSEVIAADSAAILRPHSAVTLDLAIYLTAHSIPRGDHALRAHGPFP